MIPILIILIAILLLVILVQRISVLTASALLTKHEIDPTDEEIKHCQNYVIKRLFGQKPKL